MAPRKTNKHYWQDRVREQNERNRKRTNDETKRLLRQLYQEQSEILHAELGDIFLKMLDDAAGHNRIYLNDLYRTNNYHRLINHFNECAKAIGGEQVKVTEDALLNVYALAQATVEKNLPKNMITPTFVVPEAINPEQVIHQTWCLDGKEFSDRIWQNKQALVKDLTKTLSDYAARGETPYNMAQGIVKRLEVDEYAAYRIARTETAHFQVKGQIDKYKELGFTHGRFNATDPCDDCAALDGLLFTLDELESMIPKHPNCECSFLLETEV